MDALPDIAERLRAEFAARSAARDAALTASRDLTRHCSECIRAAHRREWEAVDAKLGIITAAAEALKSGVAAYPELYHSGYVQDALKESVEANATVAILRGDDLPDPAALGVEPSTYLHGLAEAATELRRTILDLLRLSDEHAAEAERLLAAMDAIYDQLVTFDFPDAITRDLRRQTDIVRGVLERTRGDLTTTLRQLRLQDALRRFEEKHE
jgi:translin